MINKSNFIPRLHGTTLYTLAVVCGKNARGFVDKHMLFRRKT